ncbi:flagellin N-terminal helical domain-containing protein [Paramaledivibacter caminithermalis]|jgi:flagellin|uniref:Flagellin n=1 Tax=Paramaledivibacter caminithermalis (strain DSM 15212 / CIP 107654 / DViRD3) TaxID=1121301 RepID=A0A1M6L5V8_PARC5|nr:flagellin [Paramaledivibacter caminithermalis]SHJ66575.1 flagellin [Paramaledivibacter caminithermalis DSM 15212]
MRINNNIMATNAHNQLRINNFKQGKSIEKLSSGFRINRAADDAAGLAVSEKMRGQLRGLAQAQRNAQDGISLIQTAEGALNEVSDMLVRMKELAVQKESDTYSASDVDNINQEISALNAEIENITDTTKFNGKALFGKDFDIAITHSGGTITVSVDDITAPGGTAKVSDISSKIETITTSRAKLGALQNRLEHTVNNLGTTYENLQAAESRVRDTDMAKEMMNFTKFNILQQAAQSMLAQANMAPQGVLQLLG